MKSEKVRAMVLTAIVVISVFMAFTAPASANPVSGTVYVWDQPKVHVQGTEDFNYPAWGGWWVRGDSTGVEFTFTGVDPARIVSEYLDVEFSLGVTNHLNGEKGLDGLVDVIINPGIENYLIENVLLDNNDTANHIYYMGDPNGTYETKAHITVHKSYIHDGILVIKVERHTDMKDNLPAAPVCTNAPIDLGTQIEPTPIIPDGVYDYNDAHTVHIHVKTTNPPGGTIAAAGKVVMRPEWLDPPVPAPVPTITPIGLIALIGLLSVIAAISISTNIRKKRR